MRRVALAMLAKGRKTGGPPAGSLNRSTLEAKAERAALVDDPEYRRSLTERLLAGNWLRPSNVSCGTHVTNSSLIDESNSQGVVPTLAHSNLRSSTSEASSRRRAVNSSTSLAQPGRSHSSTAAETLDHRL
jgi:hypothetical protein